MENGWTVDLQSSNYRRKLLSLKIGFTFTVVTLSDFHDMFTIIHHILVTLDSKNGTLLCSIMNTKENI